MFCNAFDTIIYILNDPCIAWVWNSITRDSAILHWFQFLRLTNQEKVHSQIQKIGIFCQKYFFLLRSLVFAVKDTFIREFTTASLRRFYCLFVPWLWIIITRYLCRRHVYSRWCLYNLAERQCTFLHFFTILWRLKSDTVATSLPVNWRTLSYCAFVESRAFVNFFFCLIKGKKASNLIQL